MFGRSSRFGIAQVQGLQADDLTAKVRCLRRLDVRKTDELEFPKGKREERRVEKVDAAQRRYSHEIAVHLRKVKDEDQVPPDLRSQPGISALFVISD